MNEAQIISIINDLELQYSLERSTTIAKFCVKIYTSTLSSKKLINILLGLNKLHDLSSSSTPHIQCAAVDMLNFIYLQPNFTTEEIHLLADILMNLHGRKMAARVIMHEKSNQSPWTNTLISYVNSITLKDSLPAQILPHKIISKGLNSRFSSGENEEFNFGFYEIMGQRPSQEDALVWSPIDLVTLNNLSSEEIGMRMWTTYQNLHDNFKLPTSGTTASTTVCTKDNLITATLADTIAFAIVFDKNDHFQVFRINSRIRHADDPDETKRIIKAGSFVHDNRVHGALSPTRAIGDHNFKGVCCDADIDVFDLTRFQYATKIQLLTACDGFTEPLVFEEEREDSKENCEEFLTRYLNIIATKNKTSLADMSEFAISKSLVSEALQNGSLDNISISVQTVRKGSFFFTGMTGIYDGHGGHLASHFVAENIVDDLKSQLQISISEYTQQSNSTHNKSLIYTRDNVDDNDDLMSISNNL